MNRTDSYQVQDDHSDESDSTPELHITDLVSLETVVNILVRKGVCTTQELFEEEKKRHEYNSQVKDISLVHTDRNVKTNQEGKSHKRKQNWLKRKMSKRRWTRRLGTRLFGWQWKKIKIKKDDVQLEKLIG
ncbi:MAG: hypothetical protein ACE5HX_04015 [bacterium]